MSYSQASLDYDVRQKTYWDSQLFAEGTTRNGVSDPNLLGGTAMAAIFTRTTPVGTVEDQAQYQIHYVMRPGIAGVSDQLSSGDMSAVEASFGTDFWGPVRGLIASSWTLRELVWRDFGADFPLTTPDDPTVAPVHRYGPVRRRTPVGQTGAAPGLIRLPDQVAATITFKTGSRKHWGRIYLGGIAVPDVTANEFGRFSSANVDVFANSAHAHFTNINGLSRQIEAVVWSSRYAAIMGIDQVQVDDVPDVIRRRRAKQASYRRING